MEISRLTDSSIKIKTKNATFVIDPNAKTDADAVLLLHDTSVEHEVNGSKLTIAGPGEYEILDVVIKGERNGASYIYTLFDGMVKVVVGTSESLSKIADEEDFHAAVIKAVEPITLESLSTFTQNICVVFGENLALSGETVKKQPKVNLRKAEEFIGHVVVLAKE